MSGNTKNAKDLGRISVGMKQHIDKNRGTVSLVKSIGVGVLGGMEGGETEVWMFLWEKNKSIEKRTGLNNLSQGTIMYVQIFILQTYLRENV